MHFDVTDKLHIDDTMITRFSGINTYDVIPVDGYLFMIGKDEFYQYDYSDLYDIRQKMEQVGAGFLFFRELML